jgi:serine protease AprX
LYSNDLERLDVQSQTQIQPAGVTWFGVTWFQRLGAAIAAMAIVAAVTATTSAPDAVGVGQLSPRMVEMLNGENNSGLVDLAELRADTLGSAADLALGSGIDVALIDTGVAPVAGLDEGNVLHGPDLSMEAASSEAAYLDTYGHGTHMAGIIAGTRAGQEGIAPGARIVSVKVAGHDGVTSVPQVVAAIDWVVEHRNTDGLNIRVLNLSLGQEGVTTHVGDQLSAAVERAWDAGIVVVVAAGNDGDTQAHLDSPAISPHVLAVGAVNSDTNEDRRERRVTSWSGDGDGVRNPDLVGPGRSIASYRVPGSTIDLAAPAARHGDDLFRGSGTSQSAAVVSGVAAALLSEHPELTPDQVKDTIETRSFGLEGTNKRRMGEGHINGKKVLTRSPITNGAPHDFANAAGPGTGVLTPSGATWSGGTWSGGTWSGATWSGATWSGGTWSGATWSGASWSGATWSGATWSGGTWSGASWSGATWSGATWSGATWSGGTWS